MSFLKSTYAYVAMCLAFALMIGLLWCIDELRDEIVSLKDKLSLQKANTMLAQASEGECKSKIELINLKLERIRADELRAKEQVESLNAKFKAISVPKKDANCSAKLRFYEELLGGKR